MPRRYAARPLPCDHRHTLVEKQCGFTKDARRVTTDIGTVEQFFADVDALSATLQLDFGITPGDRPAAGYVERLAGKPAAAV